MTLLWIWAAVLVVAQVEESSAAPTGKVPLHCAPQTLATVNV